MHDPGCRKEEGRFTRGALRLKEEVAGGRRRGAWRIGAGGICGVRYTLRWRGFHPILITFFTVDTQTDFLIFLLLLRVFLSCGSKRCIIKQGGFLKPSATVDPGLVRYLGAHNRC